MRHHMERGPEALGVLRHTAPGWWQTREGPGQDGHVQPRLETLPAERNPTANPWGQELHKWLLF